MLVINSNASCHMYCTEEWKKLVEVWLLSSFAHMSKKFHIQLDEKHCCYNSVASNLVIDFKTEVVLSIQDEF